MNRLVLLLIVGALSTGSDGTLAVQLASGDGQVRPVLQPSELCSDEPDTAIATFEDANLEARVRAALSIGADEDLTCGLASALTVVDAPAAEIESLVGIQNLTSLRILRLHGNSITDIGALSGLASLTQLDLQANSITDVSVLSGRTRLVFLYLDAQPQASQWRRRKPRARTPQSR